MQITEENLVEQLKMKDEEALTYLVETHGGLFNAIIRRYLQGNQSDIEECLSDVLVAIWFHIESFDPAKNEFRQWAAAVAKYRAIDYLRKTAKANEHRSRFELDEARVAKEAVQQPLFDMETLLKGLSPVEKEIFEKYYVEGVPSKEIAVDFKANESWVHNKLSRGRKKLKTILLKEGV